MEVLNLIALIVDRLTLGFIILQQKIVNVLLDSMIAAYLLAVNAIILVPNAMEEIRLTIVQSAHPRISEN